MERDFFIGLISYRTPPSFLHFIRFSAVVCTKQQHFSLRVFLFPYPNNSFYYFSATLRCILLLSHLFAVHYYAAPGSFKPDPERIHYEKKTPFLGHFTPESCEFIHSLGGYLQNLCYTPRLLGRKRLSLNLGFYFIGKVGIILQCDIVLLNCF